MKIGNWKKDVGFSDGPYIIYRPNDEAVTTTISQTRYHNNENIGYNDALIRTIPAMCVIYIAMKFLALIRFSLLVVTSDRRTCEEDERFWFCRPPGRTVYKSASSLWFWKTLFSQLDFCPPLPLIQVLFLHSVAFSLPCFCLFFFVCCFDSCSVQITINSLFCCLTKFLGKGCCCFLYNFENTCLVF